MNLSLLSGLAEGYR